MDQTLVLFEDSRWRDLRPLTDTLPVPALAFGAASLAERWRRASRLPLAACLARPAVLAAWRDAPGPGPAAAGDLVLVNAAALPGPWFEVVRAAKPPAVFAADGVIVAARADASWIAPRPEGRPIEERLRALGSARAVAARRLAWPWELIAWNAEAIGEDLEGLGGACEGEVHPGVARLEPQRITVRRGARVDPFAVLDARGGPILIDQGAVVLPHTVVTGPCVVGPRTQLLGGFVSRTTFGPECRVAGEVEECVWQGYANKRHHGFVGHSWIGEWVNLGALTTTSDLKNNYGPVRVWVDGREIDSGSSKVGALIGDHAKTGIGTLLPTGASVGTGSNLFAGGRFAPKHLPPFSWWDGERNAEHRIEPFLSTARIAMSRRARELSAADEALLRRAFADSAAERERYDPRRETVPERRG